MWGVPIPPQRPSPSRPLPTPPSVHGGLSWSAARGFPSSSPKLGKSLAAKPDPYNGNTTWFVQWWRTVNLYLSGFETDLTDRQKMLIILSYMKGDNAAGRFADLMVTTRGINTMSFASFKEKLKDLPTCSSCSKRRDCALCIKARKGICKRLLHLVIPTGWEGQIQCDLLWLHNCQPYPMSSKVGNCGVCRMKSAWPDRLHKPSSLENGTGSSKGNPQPNRQMKAKCLRYRANI